MFGFKLRGTRQSVQPVAAHSRWNDDTDDFQGSLRYESPDEAGAFLRSEEDILLVSKEDIYTQENGHVVLLLKAGKEVPASQLSRLIRNGASPGQFRIKHETAGELPGRTYPADSMVTNPIMPISRVSKSIRSRQRVLVLEEDSKTLRRLIDCLFVCGFGLGRIHPVRMPSHLEWALAKYQPDILVVDYHLSGEMNGLELIQAVRHIARPERIILTLSLSSKVSAAEEATIQESMAAMGIQVLLKPINRYTLNSILEQEQHEAVS